MPRPVIGSACRRAPGVLAIIGLLGTTAAAGQLDRRALSRTALPQTTLEVQTLSGDFAGWDRSLTIQAPRVLRFRWGTTATATSGTWEVAARPFPRRMRSGIVIAHGNAGRAPAPGRVAVFDIDFAAFASATPPAAPVTYYVRVVVATASGVRPPPSPVVTVQYTRPGQVTTFAEDGFNPIQPQRGVKVLYQDYGPTIGTRIKPSVAYRLGPTAGRRGDNTRGRVADTRNARTPRTLADASLYEIAEADEGPPAARGGRGDEAHAELPRTLGTTRAGAITGASPPWSVRRHPGLEGPDPMIAAGRHHIVVSTAHRLGFFDKKGVQLPPRHGLPTKMRAREFFGAFIEPKKADGSTNYDNINRHLDFPANAPVACDATDATPGFPCVDEFYDTRVHFDPVSRRFFVLSAARHQLWRYSPTSALAQKNNPTGALDDLVRRYVAFAVSKTEDPRDGFHQYMVTESVYRDWPRMAVSNGSLVISWNGGANVAEGTVALVFDVGALKAGHRHPPSFRYDAQDIGGFGTFVPVQSYGDTNGLTYLLRPHHSLGDVLDIYAFAGPADPWTAPPLMKTSVELRMAPAMMRAGAIYRNGLIYFTCARLAEKGTNGQRNRFSVRVVRVPVKRVSASAIQASASPGDGFLDWFFGRNGPGDAASDLVSYEVPSLAVNGAGAMLFGYVRIGVSTAKPLLPESRYSVWYPHEPKQRSSRLLQAGSFAAVADDVTVFKALDYSAAVVDPADDRSFWVALAHGDKGRMGFKTIIARVTP